MDTIGYYIWECPWTGEYHLCFRGMSIERGLTREEALDRKARYEEYARKYF